MYLILGVNHPKLPAARSTRERPKPEPQQTLSPCVQGIDHSAAGGLMYIGK